MSSRCFEIVVRGRLSPTLASAIAGFEVAHCTGGETHLIGCVPDQAGLHSTLTVLRDLNIELTSVNPMPDGAPSERSGPGRSTRSPTGSRSGGDSGGR